MATSDSNLQQVRMDLAESLTDASRSLDRCRKKIEAVIEALSHLSMIQQEKESVEANIGRCRMGMVEIQQLNNSIRKMNT